jgi:hypothetical protein
MLHDAHVFMQSCSGECFTITTTASAAAAPFTLRDGGDDGCHHQDALHHSRLHISAAALHTTACMQLLPQPYKLHSHSGMVEMMAVTTSMPSTTAGYTLVLQHCT